MIKFKEGSGDFEDYPRTKKKKEKKLFKVVAKNKCVIEEILERSNKESSKSKLPKEEKDREGGSDKSKLMRFKRIKQKKLLEMTRGLKRIYSTDLENSSTVSEVSKKENLVKKKKALQNRISAQKSIEKKKSIINQIQSEKENLSNENSFLRLELERKNHEIELLRKKLNETQPQPISPSSFNFSISTPRNRTNFIASSILVVCLIACIFDHSTESYETHIKGVSLPTAETVTLQIPVSRVSRRIVSTVTRIPTDLYTVEKDIRLYNEMKNKLQHDSFYPNIQNKIVLPTNNSIPVGMCKRIFFHSEFCEKD